MVVVYHQFSYSFCFFKGSTICSCLYLIAAMIGWFSFFNDFQILIFLVFLLHLSKYVIDDDLVAATAAAVFRF